jgi:undecaprenyl-diphosphatase
MSFFQIALLAWIQGMAELLPVSSSAHVIMAEKWMGLDPAAPEMTFFLVMLHTGTMVAVSLYFFPRWKKLSRRFFQFAVLATLVTGFIGLGFKILLEQVLLKTGWLGSHHEVEHLFKCLPLIAGSLFVVGLLIVYAGKRAPYGKAFPLTSRTAVLIGLVQGLCLPFRGFSRSGATISTGLLAGISQEESENFSFLLALLVTPAVIGLEFYRFFRAVSLDEGKKEMLGSWMVSGALGMALSFVAGWLALRWLSRWIESGRWQFFGFYCMFASCVVLVFYEMGF